MEKSYQTIKVGKTEIEIQALEKTILIGMNSGLLDLTKEEATEFHSVLGQMLGIQHPAEYYYVGEPTHDDR